MNLGAFVAEAARGEFGRRFAMGTVTGTSGNKVVVTIPSVGSVTIPWLRTPGQNGSTTLQAATNDEVIVMGIGEPPSWVVIGIIER